MAIRYTTAPEDYDGFGTKTLEIVGRSRSKDRDVRKVEIEPEHLHWQCMRYSSGLYAVLDENQYQESVKYGFMIPKEV